jgi:hypothetical protein
LWTGFKAVIKATYTVSTLEKTKGKGYTKIRNFWEIEI